MIASETGSRNLIRLRLFPDFNAAVTLTILGKRRPVVRQIESTPIIRQCFSYLVYKTLADMLKKSDTALSKEYLTDASTELKSLVDRETVQAANEPVIHPYAEGSSLGIGEGFSIP
jgi:hypothetical protein